MRMVLDCGPMKAAGTTLPVATALPDLLAALADRNRVLLQAPPGAGKSTVVPLALLDAPWLAGRRILVLEPRRLAARAVAARMATSLGEVVGDTVGYRMRLDTRISKRTRIEVVTEGILTRQLQHDPALENTGLVIFDEFHERSLHADTGLAFVLDAQRHLRTDLRVLVMSATLDSAALARLLDNAPVISAPGLSFPVSTRYLERATSAPVDRLAVTAIRHAIAAESGDLLVFLPGIAEIRRADKALKDADLPANVRIHCLYGDLGREAQDLALKPAPPGQRKVVLATNIAETSLTIEGVRVVIDSGLERRARFDPRSGMSRLTTARISLASADQRRGRAGRLAPGVCIRLWTESEHRTLLPHTPPEIATADLSSLALELASWGARDTAALTWLTPPPPGALAQGQELLRTLGALDTDDRLTPRGLDMLALGTHPRLARMLLAARASGISATGCALAALLSERDPLRGRPGERDPDLRTRLELLVHDDSASMPAEVDRNTIHSVRRSAAAFSRQLGTDGDTHLAVDEVGWLLALAYPDRIARSREPDSGRYLLSNGRGAGFAGPTALSKAEFLVVADLEGSGKDARIELAAAVTAAEINEHFADAMMVTADVRWDSGLQSVVASREHRLGALLLASAPLDTPGADQLTAAMLTGLRDLGLRALPWTTELRQWQARVMLLKALDPAWPDVSDDSLLATLDSWLAPWLTGITRTSHLAQLDLRAALQSRLSWPQQTQLDALAPTHLTVPSGSRVALDYLDGPTPSLSVRLQEVFGLETTPRIAGGQTAVLLKLLSPARRPIQVTRDLQSFWHTTYHEVRKELKGRYPRHYWPEDPLQAEPTRRLKPRPQRR
ncbi:MAG: ATP-dependent helicase HrpB [Gammaproteobacteria bacterium]